MSSIHHMHFVMSLTNKFNSLLINFWKAVTCTSRADTSIVLSEEILLCICQQNRITSDYCSDLFTGEPPTVSVVGHAHFTPFPHPQRSVPQRRLFACKQFWLSVTSVEMETRVFEQVGVPYAIRRNCCVKSTGRTCLLLQQILSLGLCSFWHLSSQNCEMCM